MKTKQDLLRIVREQLAIEYNCSPDAFLSANNSITLSKDHPNKRPYTEGPAFFQMATFGDNAVITADRCLHEWLKEYTKDKKGYWLFEHHNLKAIDKKLEAYHKKLSSTFHMFLSYRQTVPRGINIRTEWFENEGIHPFYGTSLFPNALGKAYNPRRLDVLAVAARDGDSIAGMAGCSADTPLLWQIGVDVIEVYRGRGIASYLVTLLKNEIERRGKIPFYGTSLSNLHSWGTALNSGFSPAWIEITTFEEGEE